MIWCREAVLAASDVNVLHIVSAARCDVSVYVYRDAAGSNGGKYFVWRTDTPHFPRLRMDSTVYGRWAWTAAIELGGRACRPTCPSSDRHRRDCYDKTDFPTKLRARPPTIRPHRAGSWLLATLAVSSGGARPGQSTGFTKGFFSNMLFYGTTTLSQETIFLPCILQFVLTK